MTYTGNLVNQINAEHGTTLFFDNGIQVFVPIGVESEYHNVVFRGKTAAINVSTAVE
jgi:hypothetical protein